MISFEQFLMEKHADQYIGTKDCIVDDFADWVENLGINEWLEYGNKYAQKIREDI